MRIALLCDYPEEDWRSMDLAGEMLARELERRPSVHVARLCPPWRRRAARLPGLGRQPLLRALDGALNRHLDYPAWLLTQRGRFDAWHIVDHGYAQLAHALPAGRAGVLVHDVDAFRCLVDPTRDPRPPWARALARRVLGGLQRAGVVFHTSATVRADLVRFDLVDPARLVLAPNGVAPEFTPGPDGAGVRRAGTGRTARPYVLHVGSCAPRKRVDVLLEAMARLSAARPDVDLVQAGGRWTDDQAARLAALGLNRRVIQRTGLSRAELAELYRGAAVVVSTSDAEGFGLPVIEALACGAPVVTSDIDAYREIGGDAVLRCAPGEPDAFAAALRGVLDDPASAPSRASRLAQAARFSWAAQADIMHAAYARLVGA